METLILRPIRFVAFPALLLALTVVSPARAGDDSDVSNSAASRARVGRYVSADTALPRDQIMPLARVITTTIPESSKTVRDAVRHVLLGTGYQLLDNNDPYAIAMLSAALPDVHRSFTDASVFEILHALAGPAFDTAVDPVYRLVSFSLRDDAMTMYQPRRQESR